MSLSWPLGRPWKRERRRYLLVEECGSEWKLEFWKRLEFWKLEILWLVKEGRGSWEEVGVVVVVEMKEVKRSGG